MCQGGQGGGGSSMYGQSQWRPQQSGYGYGSGGVSAQTPGLSAGTSNESGPTFSAGSFGPSRLGGGGGFMSRGGPSGVTGSEGGMQGVNGGFGYPSTNTSGYGPSSYGQMGGGLFSGGFQPRSGGFMSRGGMNPAWSVPPGGGVQPGPGQPPPPPNFQPPPPVNQPPVNQPPQQGGASSDAYMQRFGDLLNSNPAAAYALTQYNTPWYQQNQLALRSRFFNNDLGQMNNFISDQGTGNAFKALQNDPSQLQSLIGGLGPYNGQRTAYTPYGQDLIARGR